MIQTPLPRSTSLLRRYCKHTHLGCLQSLWCQVGVAFSPSLGWVASSIVENSTKTAFSPTKKVRVGKTCKYEVKTSPHFNMQRLTNVNSISWIPNLFPIMFTPRNEATNVHVHFLLKSPTPILFCSIPATCMHTYLLFVWSRIHRQHCYSIGHRYPKGIDSIDSIDIIAQHYLCLLRL